MHAMEDKDLRFQLKIRVYGEGYKTHLSHGFLVDDMPMGVSAPVGELVIDVRQVTLAQLRPMIMYDIRGAMKRRSMLWQEVLFIFGRLHNVYDRQKSEVNKYRFGFVRKSKLNDVKLIHPSRETSPIAELIGATDFFAHDLVIVPITQLHPDIESAPPPEAPTPAAAVPESLAVDPGAALEPAQPETLSPVSPASLGKDSQPGSPKARATSPGGKLKRVSGKKK